MPIRSLTAAVFGLMLLVATILGGGVRPQQAVAGGVLVYVDTTADEDGTNFAACSLREAIKATNVNGNYGGVPRKRWGIRRHRVRARPKPGDQYWTYNAACDHRFGLDKR